MEVDHIDLLTLENCQREEKLRLINRELQAQLYKHGLLVQSWSPEISWMWARYEGFSKNERGDLYIKWIALLQQIVTDQATRMDSGGPTRSMESEDGTLDNVEEEAVLALYMDDGEREDDARIAGRGDEGVSESNSNDEDEELVDLENLEITA